MAKNRDRFRTDWVTRMQPTTELLCCCRSEAGTKKVRKPKSATLNRPIATGDSANTGTEQGGRVR
jgi:hypothetical protein